MVINKSTSWIVKRIFCTVLMVICVARVTSASSATITIDATELKELIAETKSLRKEVAELKKQVSHTHRSKKQSVKRKKVKNKGAKKEITHVSQSKKHTKVAASKSKPKLFGPRTEPDIGSTLNPNNPSLLGGGPVLIEPNTGFPPAYNGADLLTNIVSWANNDLIVLQYRERIEQTFENQSGKTPNFYAVLSGTVGGLGSYIQPYIGQPRSDIDLTIANLTTMAGLGKWVTGIVDLDYYNYAPPSENPPQYGERAANSRVYVDQGYMTIGNLDSSPIYATVGQIYVPFGLFAGYAISSPLTASLFSTKQRPLLLGYSKSTGVTELDAKVYVYQGETVVDPNKVTINEWGVSADYLVNMANWGGDIGLGYISNIADAGSMQVNGQQSSNCTLFNGYAFPCGSANLLQHRVPGFDAHVNIVLGSFNFISEYMFATRAFAPTDMTFNGKPATPKAFDIEAAYLFNVFGKPSSFATGYGLTRQALAMLLPNKSYTATFTTSIWPRTQVSLGYQRNYNYPENSTTTAQGFLPAFGLGFAQSLGRASNMYLLSTQISF